MSTAALLEVEGLNAGYGKSQVLFGMTLRVDAGTCSTLLVRNGMGMTTTINSIMGLIGPTGGAVRWCGRDVRGRRRGLLLGLGLGLLLDGEVLDLRLELDLDRRLLALVEREPRSEQRHVAQRRDQQRAPVAAL